jgi:hypothetical protein
MKQNKKYIKPYKKTFLQVYFNYMYICDNCDKSRIFNAFIDLCCCVQIGSKTNEYRVNLIDKFESKLLIKAVNKLHSTIEITEEQFDEIGNIFNQKLRYGLFYMLFV